MKMSLCTNKAVYASCCLWQQGLAKATLLLAHNRGVISVIAILFGMFSFIRKESIRISGCAAALGISAIAFQFIAMYAMALLVVILIAAVLGSIGAG